MSTERFPLQSTYACAIARHIKTAIFPETDLTAIASVSINKFLAKMASGQNKPIVF
ncbi:Y-family DNA polymerase [Nostoc sp.]